MRVPYWSLDICWDTYPFRSFGLGRVTLVIDRSRSYYARWPYAKLMLNYD